MPRMLWKNIRLRMAMLSGCCFLLVFGFSLLWFYKSFKRDVSNLLNGSLLAQARIMASRTQLSPALIPLPTDDQAIAIWYSVQPDSFSLWYHTPGFLPPSPLRMTDTCFTWNHWQLAYVSNTHTDSDTERFIFALGIPDAPIAKLFQQWKWKLYMLTWWSFLAVFALAYFFTHVLLHPIRNIIHATQHMNQTALTQPSKIQPVPVSHTNDEMEQLASTINQLLQQIKTAWENEQAFFAAASHELRTPLAIMQMQMQAMVNNKTLETTFQTLLSQQLHELGRMQRLIDNFLMASRLKNEAIQLHHTIVDLHELLSDQLIRLQPLIKEKNLFVHWQMDEYTSNVQVIADQQFMGHVLYNLLENSVKYAPEHSTIEVHLSEDQHQLFVVIRNATEPTSGYPSALTEEGEIKPFIRGDASKPGTGLGLWICAQILSLHRSHLQVSLQGNQFIASFALPLAAHLP
ncbi:MAG: HAMP domain-containing histidine kinase [Thermoflavifilum sp.]|nr:HAMP domain-containing histidine kinase [Thermoflavifilum sp.]